VTEDAHVRVNRRLWNEDADDYQRRNAPQIRSQAFTGHLSWGLWNIPESELGVLGEIAGKDILEFGCGGAQWSTALARNGARPVGFDLSERQLAHALRLREETGISIPLVQADAERTPFRDASFDVVFADYGAFLFADPYRAVPEAARILRPGGLLAFTHLSPSTTSPSRRTPTTPASGWSTTTSGCTGCRTSTGRSSSTCPTGAGSGCSATAAWWSRT
jgi:SAM-dependent methyltransferase